LTRKLVVILEVKNRENEIHPKKAKDNNSNAIIISYTFLFLFFLPLFFAATNNG
jgi:hypothetical protein